MTQVLARKWRPKTFAELTGQEHVVQALTNALSRQRLHHAYLFTGTRGVGKTTLARIIAKALNCENGITAEPCGKCTSCTEIEAGRFVDLIELDAASNTQVDRMRELLESALYAPSTGRFKVYIIDEVHMLSRSAFNAMLKTLEEPPPHVKFVLATTDPQRVPVTVLSRCLQFNLKQIPPAQIVARLQQILDAEKISAEPAALTLLAGAAEGSLRDALSLLDQAIAHGGGEVAEAAVRAMLGTVDRGYLHAILHALAAGDGAALIAEADRMAGLALSFDAALQELASLLNRLALTKAVPGSVADADMEREVLHSLAARFEAEDLQLYYQIAVQGRGDIGLAPDEYAGFTMTLLRMLAFASGHAGERSYDPRSGQTDAGTGEPAAAANAAAAPSKKGARRDAAWSTIVENLGLSGMANMLALNCELVRRDDELIELKIGKAHEHLLDKRYQDRLRAALQAHFGAPLGLTITVGAEEGNSPAAIAARERSARQAQAIAEIEQDPFVRDLVEHFDARVVESTIKPNQ